MQEIDNVPNWASFFTKSEYKNLLKSIINTFKI